jgi:hypothetical protein
MAACGKPGKTIRLFSHPSHSPWKSLRRLPHFHRHDDHGVGCKFPKTRPLRDTHSEGKVILAEKPCFSGFLFTIEITVRILSFDCKFMR